MTSAVPQVCTEGCEWVGHRVLCREVRVELEFEALEPLRIGAGREAKTAVDVVDLPVFRRRVPGSEAPQPVLPGSSLKGVLRTASAMLCLACGLEAHTGIALGGGRADDCVDTYFGSAGGFDSFRKARSPSEVKRLLLGFCPTCLLYGARSYASKLVVGDFEPVLGTLRVGVKTGVGIDRRRGAAARGVLYSVEYVEPGSRFRGYLVVENAPNWMLSLLAASLMAVHEGWLKLGGFKSRGMGRVRIVEESVNLTLMPAERAALEKLDLEVDEVHEVAGCRLESGVLSCRGAEAFKVLRELASSWSAYCTKLREVLARRREEAKSLVTG